VQHGAGSIAWKKASVGEICAVCESLTLYNESNMLSFASERASGESQQHERLVGSSHGFRNDADAPASMLIKQVAADIAAATGAH